MKKIAIDPNNRAKCPNCEHEFDYNETFAWLADHDGHPTIEALTCPYCGIGTTSIFQCTWCPGQHEGQFKCNLEGECSACASVKYEDFFKEPADE